MLPHCCKGNVRLVLGWYFWTESSKPPWSLIYSYCRIVWYFYCFVTGFVIQFSFLFMAITWNFYVIHLFLGLKFPFWSVQFFKDKTHTLKICLLEIFGAITFSILLPTIVLSVSKFKLARFPPVFVYPTKDLALYTFLLPIAILLIVGVNLTFICFWVIHKVKYYPFTTNVRYLWSELWKGDFHTHLILWT